MEENGYVCRKIKIEISEKTVNLMDETRRKASERIIELFDETISKDPLIWLLDHPAHPRVDPKKITLETEYIDALKDELWGGT